MKGQLSEDKDTLFIFKPKLQMKKILFRSPFILFFMGAVFTTIETRGSNLLDSIPKGWRTGANNPPDIVIGTDTTASHSGKASAFVQRALALKISPGSGVLMQSIASDPYRNKRVRLSVYVRSKEVELGGGRGASLYFRVDGQDSVLAFFNRFCNLTEETTDWIWYHITLDVPETSVNMDFGAILTAQGMIWIDDWNLEVVDQNIPSDDWVAPRKMKGAVTIKNYKPNTKAINLGFEDR